ncbi:MAG TPA: cytochrome c family protein [Reyranella sp.]|jgi:cytochrome c
MDATVAGGLAVALVLAAGSALAEGNETRGERLFNQQCKACHTLEQGGHNLVGPNLHGLFGRKAGSADYQYSDAMKKSGITWDEKTLVDYLKDPKGKVPGTKMTFIGLRQEQQQDDMIAFLKKATE